MPTHAGVACANIMRPSALPNEQAEVMTSNRSFRQVDVFTETPQQGNPVAVVLDADGLTTEQMQRFANWTNLSETTFVLAPQDGAADYRVRIFTPGAELPFAGHPTLGTCHAWLESGGTPKAEGTIVQECELGLIPLRSEGELLAFAAPDLIRSGPVDDSDLAAACEVLRIAPTDVVDAQWADNGPGWMAILLRTGELVRSLTPDFGAGNPEGIGVVGPHTLGVAGFGGEGGTELEVRAFFSANDNPVEDPVTGSLNAAVAQWLLAAGHLSAPYVASQGTCIGRAGRVHISEADGDIWVGGRSLTCIVGTVAI